MTFLDALVLWIHILAAAVFVGPQVFLVFVAMPAIRTMSDAQARRDITRKVTRGFGAIGGAAFGVLLITGIWNYFDAKDQDKLEVKRYFITLQIKLTLVVVVLILTALHGAVFGRQIQRLEESGASEAELEAVRQRSMIASIANLVASVLILLCAAVLASTWSLLGDQR